MERKTLLKPLIAFISLVCLSGCASKPDSEAEFATNGTQDAAPKHANDPFESFNRAMWWVNYEVLDPYVVRPVSLGYGKVVPNFARKGIANFLSNLDEPASAVNDVLMGNGEEAFVHFNRFWVNTTFGVAGLMDVASDGGLDKLEDRAFSDAVGHVGVGNGWYFMLPAYGPVTTRETTDYVDFLYPPLSLLTFWSSAGKWLFEGMETRIELVEQEPILQNSPDPYALTREVYLQRRDFKAEVSSDDPLDAEEEAELDAFLEDL